MSYLQGCKKMDMTCTILRDMPQEDILRKKFPTVFGDIGDAASVKNVVKELQPEIVVHFAALTSVTYRYEHPVEVLEANLIGTVNLAEACRTEVKNFN